MKNNVTAPILDAIQEESYLTWSQKDLESWISRVFLKDDLEHIRSLCLSASVLSMVNSDNLPATIPLGTKLRLLQEIASELLFIFICFCFLLLVVCQ